MVQNPPVNSIRPQGRILEDLYGTYTPTELIAPTIALGM